MCIRDSWWGIIKADVGIKDGMIFEIGKAGNPDIQDNVDIVIGASTEVIAGEGHILTAGSIDTHIHFICPQQIETALASGITTMLGGGTGPATGTNATTCTPGSFHISRIIPSFIPTSALIIPHQSTIKALVITVSTAPSDLLT